MTFGLSATALAVIGTGAVVGGGLAGGAAFMKSDAENTKLTQQQSGLQIQQNNVIANLLSIHTGAREGMRDSRRQTAQALTNVERDYLKKAANHIAVRATSGTAGLSALAAYTNLHNQKAITKGNVITAGEGDLIKRAKTAQEGVREGQGRMNDFQGQLNMAQASKKSATDMAIEVGMATVGGAMKGASSGAGLAGGMKGAGGTSGGNLGGGTAGGGFGNMDTGVLGMSSFGFFQ
jgi:hypothetical protein